MKKMIKRIKENKRNRKNRRNRKKAIKKNKVKIMIKTKNHKNRQNNKKIANQLNLPLKRINNKRIIRIRTKIISLKNNKKRFQKRKTTRIK